MLCFLIPLPHSYVMEIPYSPTLADELGTQQIICKKKSCVKP